MLSRILFTQSFLSGLLKKQHQEKKPFLPPDPQAFFKLLLKKLKSIAQIKFLPFGLVSCLFLIFLGHRLMSLKSQLLYYEQMTQAFQTRLQRKKTDLAFLKSIVKQPQPVTIEYLTNQPQLTRIDFVDRLKRLARSIGFEQMEFHLMPAKKVIFKKDLEAWVTPVSINYYVTIDHLLRHYIEGISKDIPCFLVPKRLTVGRTFETCTPNIGKLSGSYLLDWVVFNPKEGQLR